MLIADRDGSRKETRKTELQDKLGDRYYLLQCNEIENTLSLKDLERVLVSYEDSFVMPGGVNNTSRRNRHIGEFIEEDIFQSNGLTITRTGKYKDSSGTIKQKLAFCRRAIAEMTFESMSLDAKKLTEALYRFLSSET
jgi:hypothetical protein